jgi:hypothetical protein
MFREINSSGTVSSRQGDDSVLRHPDGSINLSAYRAAASRERRAAIVESIQGAASFVRAAFAWAAAAVTGKSGSPAAKQPVHHAR